ncbi:MAG: hypothetical protein KZQ95_16880 [Candidatus Thiodiazotropha sp. (ex Epidulcina cf. delphinae)]|nr:hypothetical protein [Candidatus Thiodiazotropha sp. (ex Epidulcina cf. delphinae)]MCU7929016.1 hypothetical protein [Candidatus Thiodiazotropha sp. (ex Dulcina madagascariensis)]
MSTKTITLGELKQLCLDQLQALPDDTLITFGKGDFSFYRSRTSQYRDDKKTPQVVQIEFNEFYEVTHEF